MESPPHSKPLKAKTFSLVTLLLFLPLVEGNSSPHQVHHITWRVFNTETGNSVNETTGIGPIATYFPTLMVDLCDKVGEGCDPRPQEPFPGYGCQHPGWRVKTRGHDFYVMSWPFERSFRGSEVWRARRRILGYPGVRPGVVKQQEP